jgi:hypothetical protein
MGSKRFLIWYKQLFGAVGLFAIIQEIVVLSERGTFNLVNFFSFFTIQSNLFAVIMLFTAAAALRSGLKNNALQYLRGASSLYMVITGVIFAVLLSNYDPRVLTAVPIDNTILHYIMPVVMVIDWLIDPPARRLSFVHSLIWLAYPLLYLGYTLIRGVNVGWYPYPFLNPATGGGYSGIIATAIGITIFVVVVAWVMTRVGHRR